MDSLALAKKRAQKEKGLGRRSKLDEHIKAIDYLLNEENFSLKQIQTFLKEDCKCEVSYSNLQGFCKRRFSNKDDKQIKIEEDIVIENKFDDNKKNKAKDPFENLKK